MVDTVYKKLLKLLETNQIPLLIFFSSLFIFITFAGTLLFLSDNMVILNQFHNLIKGSLSIESIKVILITNDRLNIGAPYLVYGNILYGKFSYSLLILSLPLYYILKTIDFLYGAHLFLLQLWALSGGIVVYLIAKNQKIKHEILIGAISYFILATVNMYFLKPIYFPVWGEVLSIEFTNILISSFIVLFVYLFFKNFFGSKLATFASFFVIFATPISFYAISLKHHSLSLLLTILTFYFFYKYMEKKDNKFMYYAYILTGLCLWTRILDGATLLVSLLITDVLIFRRRIKYILSISLIILISLMPFFSFNYLILGTPFSIVETTQSSTISINAQKEQDDITLYETPTKVWDIKKKLGYNESAEIKSDWMNVLLDITFLKLKTTFGIFLVSPFLATALAFLVDRIKRKIKLNRIDKFFGLYTILFVSIYKDYLLTIITDTPDVLEYRYLLILYIILLYFALRIDKVKELIESKLKTIILLYVLILIIIIVYFIEEFPVIFMNIYYYAALITSLSLIILLSMSLLTQNNKSAVTLLENLIPFIIALSLALSSFFLLFYYWIVSMTYLSPSQNHTILPVLENILKWMYQMIL